MKKRLLTFLLALALVFAFMPAGALSSFASGGELSGKIVILHSNDVHGALDGYQYMTGLKAYYEDKGADVILADAGDYSQGSVYVSTSKGASAVELMNAAGYDVATLGNHEFDYGYEQLQENLKSAKFQVVCANILKSKKALYPGHTIIEKDGVKIGFFGLDTPEAQTAVNPALIKGLTIKTGQDFKNCARTQAEALKNEGADLVIALVHLGVDEKSMPYTSEETFRGIVGNTVDFVIDGHSHTVMEQGSNGESIQSTGTAFANIGFIVIDKATKKIESSGLFPLKSMDEEGNEKFIEGLPSDSKVKDAAQAIIDKVDAGYGEVFAVSEVTLNGAKAADAERGIVNGNRDGETNNGNLITDAMLWSVKSTKGITKVDSNHIVAILNGGAIRESINPGEITKQDINSVLPFGNTVAVVYVTGAKLLEALEASTYCTPSPLGAFPQIAGMKVVVNTAKKYDAKAKTYPDSTYYGPKTINRVTIKSVNGKKFNPKDTYAVVTNNFCAAGGDAYYAFASAKSKFDTGIALDETVMNFVKTKLGGVIGKTYAEPQGRLSLVNVALAKPVVKLAKSKAKFTASWGKNTSAAGFVVKYAKNKKFKNAKSVTVKVNKAQIKKLKAGKYYVKVRAYKSASGVKYYSAWSTVKSVKVK